MNILDRVRYSRNCTNDTFPLPSPADCLWYAHTEGAEAIDAWLRRNQPEHVRNNARNTDMRKEVGQAILAGLLNFFAHEGMPVTVDQFFEVREVQE